jgi:hypothetical protein
MFQSPAQPQMSRTKRAQDRLALPVCVTSGWNCTA